MIFKNKIEEITLDKKGMILSYNERTGKQILFSELDGIYITVNKISPFYEFIIILISVCIAIFSLLFLQTNIIPILSFLLFITIVVKMNSYKRYGLKICLKNGETIENKVPTKSKHKTVDIVNHVRKEVYNYKIKKSNEEALHFSV